MKVEILIPNTKESERLPNKNRVLRKYTLGYLEHELKRVQEHCKCMWRGKNNLHVQVTELRNLQVPVDTSEDGKYSYEINAVFCPNEVSNDMMPLLRWYDTQTNADIIILLQLTQPKRRDGLIVDAVNHLLKRDTELVTSYVTLPFNDAWRICNAACTNWNEPMRHNENVIKLYDGAIYGYVHFSDDTTQSEYTNYFKQREENRNCNLLWNFERDKYMIENYKGDVTDIDYLQDLEKFLTEVEK